MRPELGHALRRLLERQVALANQPLVEAEAAVHALGAVIGDDQDARLRLQQAEEVADVLIQGDIVVPDGVLKGVARLVFGVLPVEVPPEAMMDAVGPISTMM